jgi:hypothetical protein
MKVVKETAFQRAKLFFPHGPTISPNVLRLPWGISLLQI